MRVMRGRLALALVGVIVLGVGCGGSDARSKGVTVEITHGTTTVIYVAEVAADPAQRGRGLKGRESLAANRAMLFLFPVKVQTGFWMKDTLIPLDIAFISDDRIIEIRSMTPCRQERCPLTIPASGYDSALEVNAGSFARANITVGDHVEVNGPLPNVS
jgi:uncharacterized protein